MDTKAQRKLREKVASRPRESPRHGNGFISGDAVGASISYESGTKQVREALGGENGISRRDPVVLT